MTLIEFVAAYGYLAVLLGTLLEGETVLLLAGFAAHQGHLAIHWVLLIAFIGGTLGDIEILRPPGDAELDFGVRLTDGDGDWSDASFTVGIDGDLDGDVENPISLTTLATTSFLSSSLIKDVAKWGGDISPHVPDVVANRLRERLSPARS